jgi:hypothetical protein
VVLSILKELVSSGEKIKKICMDNAGENKILAEEVKQIGTQVEFATVVSPDRAMACANRTEAEILGQVF